MVGTLGQRGNTLRRSGRGRCLALLVGLLIAALGASGAPAHAATKVVAPDPHGVIHACIGGGDGNELHVVNAGECPDRKDELTWNWRGRRGPRGKAGAGAGSFASLLLELSLSDDDEKEKPHEKGWLSELIEEVASESGNVASLLGNVASLLGLLVLALVLALSLARWLVSLPWRWHRLRRWRRFRRIGRFFGPALQIEAFEDGAMTERVGPSFALLAQARIDGGRESGTHLYLVTGEERTGDYVAALQGVPQTQALAVALSLLRLLWRKQRLTVSGSLKPIDDRQTATATVSLRLDAKLIDTSEFWLGEPSSPKLTPFASNRVLAVAVAGWIEHEVIDETPGPPAHEVLLSRDSRSWALFRAGAELNRMSLLDEAADLYERALEIDRDNIGALIDLAHLRRLDGHYDGAVTLASDALELIKRRNHAYKRRNDEDPNWYRAQIVLATTRAEWARDKNARDEPPSDVYKQALDGAVLTAAFAMRARNRLERLLPGDTLPTSVLRGEIGVRAYLAARWRARVRRVERPPPEELAAIGETEEDNDEPPESRLPSRKWRTFKKSVVPLHTLLATTFEPGALLLIASSLAPSGSFPHVRGTGPPPKREELDDLRAKIKLRPPNAIDITSTIEYVAGLPNRSPRVLYNLACWYAREAHVHSRAPAKAYIGEAFELLRQSISRTPPLERRSLLSHAELDRDLEKLRRKRGADVAGLWRLVPTEAARLRDLDRFVQTATRWARKTAHVQGLAVVGSWGHGQGADADNRVSILLRTDKLGHFADSNDWLGVFDHPALLRVWRTGSLYRPRIELRSGLAIDFWIAAWDRIVADSDIRTLAGEGYEVLFDPGGDLEELLAVLAREAQAASRSSGDKKEA